MSQEATTQEEAPLRFEPWMRGLLLIAGIYNLAWGIFIYNFQDAFYHWVKQTEDAAPPIITWQGAGVLFFGIVYIVIAVYPKKFWYLLVIGIFTKLVGTGWFYIYIMNMQTTKQYFFHLIMNDLIWVIPFVVITFRAVKVYGLFRR